MDGWILLHKKLLKWEWFQNSDTLQLFLYCLLRANFEPAKWQGIDIQRGQFITSLPTIERETGLTIQKIRTSINRLKSTGELTDKSTNKFRLITVCKYDSYQNINEILKQTNQQAIQQSANRQVTADKEYKEYKEIYNERLNVEFDTFWIAYDKKRGDKEKLKKKWESLSKEDREEIMAYLPKYRESQPNKLYRKDPLSFLNQKAWNDELIFNEENQNEKTESIYRV